jgi:hypothetical protein
MSIMAVTDRGDELARASCSVASGALDLEILAASVHPGSVKMSTTTVKILISRRFRDRFLIRRVIFTPFLGIDEELRSNLLACCNELDCLTWCGHVGRQKGIDPLACVSASCSRGT